MNVKLVNNGTEGELILVGRLDSATATQLEEIFKSVGDRFEYVVLNLSDLEYTCSSGLRLVLNLHRAMNAKGGRLDIKGAGKMVMEVFEMTGFATFLNFI